MLLAIKLPKDILKMDLGETNCFKITDGKFLYVENWCDEGGNWFTTLELNNGSDTNDRYELDEVVEIITLEYRNKEEIMYGVMYILSHCNYFYDLIFKLFY